MRKQRKKEEEEEGKVTGCRCWLVLEMVLVGTLYSLDVVAVDKLN